jgi:hypothetical protein
MKNKCYAQFVDIIMFCQPIKCRIFFSLGYNPDGTIYYKVIRNPKRNWVLPRGKAYQERVLHTYAGRMDDGR